ncbi:MAG TPA: hypothetical protein VFJ90_04360, partial [Candidatus Didemnitutus sp.]|nr:hypothetical protein [Candidatus Didemnitutus sp.]
PNRFISRDSLFSFGKVVSPPAAAHGIKFRMGPYYEAPLKIREVLFVDTEDFRLYKNAFILRRRIEYQDGFPVSDPEVVFKWRGDDIQKAAATDVRPHIAGDHRVKFKVQVLPRKDKLGGIRMLYSHNVQFPRSHVKENDVFSFDTISRVFPVLAPLSKGPNDRIKLVNGTIIEEVLQDIGIFDFGNGVTAKANVGIWRTRGEHRPLIGEFAYQFQFRDRDELKLEDMVRLEKFFVELQYAAKDWIALNATKTGIVYRLLGNPPQANE